MRVRVSEGYAMAGLQISHPAHGKWRGFSPGAAARQQGYLCIRMIFKNPEIQIKTPDTKPRSFVSGVLLVNPDWVGNPDWVMFWYVLVHCGRMCLHMRVPLF